MTSKLSNILLTIFQVEEPMSANEYLEVDDHLLGETERIPTDEDVIDIVTGIETPEPWGNTRMKAQFRQ